MSKKRLLEESTVKKFMKLAKIDASKSKKFLNENYGIEEAYHDDDEEMDEMGYGSEIDEMDVNMPKEDELSLDELDLFEEEEEEGEEEEMGELAMSSEEAEQIIDTLEMLLDKLRMAVGTGKPEEEPEEEPEMEEPEEAPEEAPEEEPEEEAPEALQEAMVNRIAKRVAARLLKEKNRK